MGFFDLHCDTLWKINQLRREGKDVNLLNNDLCVDVAKLIKANAFAQCFALYSTPQETSPLQAGLKMIGYLKDACEKSDKIKIIKNYGDFAKNSANGVVSAIITVEDAFIFENDLKNVDLLYDLGLKMVCISHNVYNGFGYPNITKNVYGTPDFNTRETKNGLTDFGFELVKKLNDLGIIVDLSHMSDAGFYDAIKVSKKPLVASHSNADGVCPSPRNLTDDMLYKLADNGGVIGVCFVDAFLDANLKVGKNTLDCTVRHIDYIKNLIGIDHISIGSDFDGMPSEVDFKDCTHLNLLITALEKKGYTTTEIEKISRFNALRVFKENMKS